MLRNVGAALAGLVTAVLVYTLIREVGNVYYAPPPELDFSDLQSVHRYHAQLPFGAYLVIIGKPVLAAFAGTVVASLVGTMNPVAFGAIVGGVVLAYSVALFIAVPHPLWLVIAALAGVVLGTYIAIRLMPHADHGPLELFNNESDPG